MKPDAGLKSITTMEAPSFVGDFAGFIRLHETVLDCRAKAFQFNITLLEIFTKKALLEYSENIMNGRGPKTGSAILEEMQRTREMAQVRDP